MYVYVFCWRVKRQSVLYFCLVSLAIVIIMQEIHGNRPSLVAIVVIVKNDTDIREYQISLESVECYAYHRGYSFHLIKDTGPDAVCQQKDHLFRRHCLVAMVLSEYRVVAFLDADIGVVNPNRSIEQYEWSGHDITFYDRHQNWEVATGSYIARATPYALAFLNELANYEDKLPADSFHGSDNGAIHMLLAEKLVPSDVLRDSGCIELYKNSRNFEDLFGFEACIRELLNNHRTTDKIRILGKGEGWVRDGWLTNSLWNPKLDFMIHGWKMSQLREVPDWELRPEPLTRNQWYNPLDRRSLEQCVWKYDSRLIGDEEEIKKSLEDTKQKVEELRKKALIEN
uniref:Glyco_transf_7C domain-containing protein n=1 Tax=Caenorhabditis tropicalis TaxID=1561998 RepID=A0A1I7V276_9PELO